MKMKKILAAVAALAMSTSIVFMTAPSADAKTRHDTKRSDWPCAAC